MKQEDLKNLKIEDLEEVTDGHYVFGQKVLLVSDLNRFSITVFAIVKDNVHGIITDNEYYSSKIFKAYKIPKPQKRERNSLEVMEYLHLLQLWSSGIEKIEKIKKENNNFELPYLSETYPEYYLGRVVVLVDEKPHDISYYSPSNERCYFGFAILKNGKVTEFKIPQIEA